MTRRITASTGEQPAERDAHAHRWIARSSTCGPPDQQEWWSAAEQCCRSAGVAWPERVVVVPSPVVGAFAAPVAAQLLAQGDDSTSDQAVDRVVGAAAVGDAVHRQPGKR